MNKKADVYGEPVVYRTDNCITTVRRPILTDEERAQRLNQIKKAACDLVLATERVKAQKNMDK